MTTIRAVLAGAMFFAAPAVAAAAPPTADEAMKTVTYYYEGAAEGPVLIKSVACLKIDEAKDSKTKNDCLEPVTGPVAKGTKVSARTMWLVPVGGKYEDVTIQVVHDGVVRETKDVALTIESLRMRTWKTTTLSKAGKWEFKIARAGTELANLVVDVSK